MADVLNLTNLTSEVWKSFPVDIIGGFSFIISLAKIAGVLVLIYLAFLIIQAVIKIRQSLRLKQMQEDISEIKDSLAILAHKKSKRDKKSK